MPKVRSKKGKKRRFYGNRYTSDNLNDPNNLDETVTSASSSKIIILDNSDNPAEEASKVLTGNRIFDIYILASVFTVLCCPDCLESGLKLEEDSMFGICSNFTITCNCGYKKAFSSTMKKERRNDNNSLLVLGLRLIGKGFTAGKKFLTTLSLPCLSKSGFKIIEQRLLEVAESVAKKNMEEAAAEVLNVHKKSSCGVSVDGTWQRRGYSSLNGCVSAISIDTGKILDIEALSQYCRICTLTSTTEEHICANHKGSAGSMEVIGAYRMFERSSNTYNLKYTAYYGDGDSKGYMAVKDIYGPNTVEKLECIGHVQKRVGSRLRKLKKDVKGLGGKGKLTDKFIDKLQNYYGIAVRSNVGNLPAMQSAVIAAFFHCCSSNKKAMHGQCPTGPDSWCKFQRALHNGHKIMEKSPGLPESIINRVKPIYMSVCDKDLLSKCLHGMTQNRNESFNNLLWTLIPKETFVGLQTLRLGTYIAVILFNSGFSGLWPLFDVLQVHMTEDMKHDFIKFDKVRINNSKLQSLPSSKLCRKKRKAARKSKSSKFESEEGISYKPGEF